MRHSFWAFMLCGLMLTCVISSADPQDSVRKNIKRNTSTMHRDTASTRRIDPGNRQPALQKTDSLPIPPPVPPTTIPRPDTMHKGMMK